MSRFGSECLHPGILCHQLRYLGEDIELHKIIEGGDIDRIANRRYDVIGTGWMLTLVGVADSKGVEDDAWKGRGAIKIW